MDARKELEELFPNLRVHAYQITSPKDKDYNCIAHAASASDAWWWPQGSGRVYWPAGVPRERTLAAFTDAYATLGYGPCGGPELEVGFEKVALYADASGVPTHAARQIPSGMWTSKLGKSVDIEHDALSALDGELYGKAVRFLKRPREGK